MDFLEQDWLDELMMEGCSSSTTANSTTAEAPTIESIIQAVKEADRILLAPVTIYIWRGEKNKTIRSPILCIDLPILKCSDMIGEASGYLMAGVGIVAGRLVYDYLCQIGAVLKWSDEFIPLEDQEWYHIMRGNE